MSNIFFFFVLSLVMHGNNKICFSEIMNRNDSLHDNGLTELPASELSGKACLYLMCITVEGVG